MDTRTSGQIRAYLVCATPRSGSSLLCGLLQSTGVAGIPESYFRQPDELTRAEEWRILDTAGGFSYLDFVRAAVDAGRADNGVFGAKVMWGTLEEMVTKLANAYDDQTSSDLALLQRAFGSLRFVFIQRNDVLAQAVSRLRAEQTDQWYDVGQGLEPKEAAFDLDGIEGYIREAREHNAGWQQWFEATGIQPYRVHYEELVEDMPGVTQGILDFLGLELPPGREIAAKYRRQRDDVNAEWMDRYRAAAHLAPTMTVE